MDSRSVRSSAAVLEETVEELEGDCAPPDACLCGDLGFLLVIG